ncbi:MAG: T9SS type A sorting domain-containing protein, partial [Flavobacteriia bacterium]|nr:T9SS type A sorting domain-containing protein [Flavobacteriia bacterium]
LLVLQLAVVSNSTGCYCNNVPVFATKNCCLCPTSIPANNSVVTLQSIDVNVSNTYNYTITGYPTTLSNFTGNQNDPSLFIWNPMSSVWEYPDPIALGQTTYYADFKSISPTSIVMYFVQPTFPLNIQTLIYYPKIDLYGNRCSPDLLCHSTLLGQKSSTYGIPCSVSSFQNTDCVSTSASYNFNEVNCSNAVINGNNHVCVGSTNQLVCSATPASTSPWTSSSPNKATVSNTGMVTGVQVGNTMIYYQASNGCIASKQIYIDSKPVVNSITSTTASCNTSKLLTANLNTSSQTGGTYSWTPGGSTGTNNILTVYPTSTTNYSVIYTGPNGCSSSPVSINVSSVVGSVSINVPVNVCGGSAITLTATIPSTMPAGGTYTWYPGGSTGTANTLSQNPMTNVSYSVNYTVNGCTYSSGSSAVSYNSTTPKTTITTNLPTYYCTQTPTFTGTLNSGSCFQYSWEIQKYDGNVLSGSAVSSGTFLGNPGTYSFPWSTISNLGGCGHYYRVKLRTQSSFVGGCVWESYKTIFISLDYAIQPKSMTSSLEENSIENQVFIYPNPSEGIFYIDYNNLKIENIIIYSMLGEKVNEKIISYEEEEIKVDLSAYPSAVYLMKIKIGDEIVYKKLIKN